MARIGIFDSGVGGLTVQRALLEALPGADTVYLGDTARVPYGTKSAATVTQYSLRNARVLEACGIDLLVVACNTASAVALPALREALPVPVLGVVEPGARAAVRATSRRADRRHRHRRHHRLGRLPGGAAGAAPRRRGGGAGLPALRAAGRGGLDRPGRRGGARGGAALPGAAGRGADRHAGAGLHPLPAAQGGHRRRAAGGHAGRHGRDRGRRGEALLPASAGPGSPPTGSW